MPRGAKLNYFNLTHSRGTTMDMGKIYPVDFVECLPGDIFRIQNEFLVRFMPTIAPVMNRFKVSLRWWYCPTRLLWEDWTNYITGGPDGTDNSVEPYVMSDENGFAVGSLADYFRVPTGVPYTKTSAKPFRMYDLIFNTWYRNEAIQDPLDISLAEGEDTTTSLDLQYVNWRRDYFTDGLPTVQKGPSIGIPLSGTAPILRSGAGKSGIEASVSGNLKVRPVGAGVDYSLKSSYIADTGGQQLVAIGNSVPGTGNDSVELKYASGLRVKEGDLIADLTNASGATINQIRLAAAIQQFQELNERASNSYVNFVLAQYGVRTPDASLQRPIYVGGMTSNVVISEVLQTSQSTENSAQGTMAGHGIGTGVSPMSKFRSLEHGYLMCLMTVVPDAVYFQGMPRELSRETRYDYSIPLLGHVGERATANGEIFYQGTQVVDENGVQVDKKPFAYLPKDEEYRRISNSITGQLRTSLSFWTSARKFDELPTLSAEFIEAHPNMDFFATEDGSDHLVVQVMHHMDALRPVSKRGTPGMHII